jgi:hypothetical protein
MDYQGKAGRPPLVSKSDTGKLRVIICALRAAVRIIRGANFL